MKKLISLILLAIGISFFTSNVYAMCGMCGEGHTKSKSASTETKEGSKLIEVNNKICPVTGDKIAEKSKASYTYKGKVYDVTDSEQWSNGEHYNMHFAGADLTEALTEAPHGDEVFERCKVVGILKT